MKVVSISLYRMREPESKKKMSAMYLTVFTGQMKQETVEQAEPDWDYPLRIGLWRPMTV